MARKTRERPGFFIRFFYGVMLPVGLLVVLGVAWFQQNPEALPVGRKWSLDVFDQRVQLHPAIALRAMLILPMAFGMCFRLILFTRRQTRSRLFVKGVVAAAMATGLGLFMFQFVISLLSQR